MTSFRFAEDVPAFRGILDDASKKLNEEWTGIAIGMSKKCIDDLKQILDVQCSETRVGVFCSPASNEVSEWKV